MQHLCRFSDGKELIVILSRKNTMDIKIRDNLRKMLKEKYYIDDDLVIISHNECEDNDDNKDKKDNESRRERGRGDEDEDERRRRRSGTMNEQREIGAVGTATTSS